MQNQAKNKQQVFPAAHVVVIGFQTSQNLVLSRRLITHFSGLIFKVSDCIIHFFMSNAILLTSCKRSIFPFFFTVLFDIKVSLYNELFFPCHTFKNLSD